MNMVYKRETVNVSQVVSRSSNNEHEHITSWNRLDGASHRKRPSLQEEALGESEEMYTKNYMAGSPEISDDVAWTFTGRQHIQLL